MKKTMAKKQNCIDDLYEAMLLIKTKNEYVRFMQDLCTPQELKVMAERWRVCRLLHQGELSYRAIHDATGSSLATITRVARFLKNEPHQGYRSILEKLN